MKSPIFTLIFIFLIVCCPALNLAQDKMDTDSDSKIQPPLKLLVGTFTSQKSRGIYQLEFDPKRGTLTNKGLVAETSNPSFFSISKDGRFVYAVNEDEEGTVSSFQWNEDRTQLNLISQLSSEGGIPCHTELNEEEDLLAVSNYRTGNFSIYELSDDGVISTGPITRRHEGSGPDIEHQSSARGHCMKFGLNGRFIYAVDMGIDQIVTYPVSGDGEVGEASSRVVMDPGDGPRHLIFHPKLDLAFVVNQLSGSVVSMRVDHSTGVLERIDKLSTLPDDYLGKNACADIHITSNGRFLYASNRIHDSIAIFEVSENGELQRLGIEPVRGAWPRNFIFSPDEKYMLVANQKTDNVTVFSVNPETGALTYTGNHAQVSMPVVMKF